MPRSSATCAKVRVRWPTSWHYCVTAAASIFAGILVLYVVFVLFKATPTNSIVQHIDKWAYDLAGPFRTLFAFKNKNHLPNVKLNAAVNYGIAALAYLFGGRIFGSRAAQARPGREEVVGAELLDVAGASVSGAVAPAAFTEGAQAT